MSYGVFVTYWCLLLMLDFVRPLLLMLDYVGTLLFISIMLQLRAQGRNL